MLDAKGSFWIGLSALVSWGEVRVQEKGFKELQSAEAKDAEVNFSTAGGGTFVNK